jgi:hypothetical protein
MARRWGLYARSSNKHPEVTSHHRLLAALTGDLTTAREAVAEILRTHPRASVAAMRASHPMRHLTSYFDKLVEGLRLETQYARRIPANPMHGRAAQAARKISYGHTGNDICPYPPLLSPAVAAILALALQDLSC